MCSPEIMRFVRAEVSRRQLIKGVAAGSLSAGVAGFSQGRTLAQEGTPIPVVLPTGFTQTTDLTHIASPTFPTYPGTPQMEIENLVTVEKDGYFANMLRVHEHTATHMDAPAHFIQNGATTDLIDVRTLVAPLCVVNVADRTASDPDTQVMVDDLLAWETANGMLPAGAFIAMYSGWESRLSDPASFINLDAGGVQHYPGFHPDAATFLVTERDIVGIGVDTLSQDFGPSVDFGTHIAILGAGKYGVENLANLGNVPATGGWVVVGGPKHLNGSGGPTRVIAMS